MNTEGFKKIRGNTYYLPQKTNIGVIEINDQVILIDSGNDKDAGRKIRQILDEEQMSIKYILNTHSNADHIGANAYLMNQYHCSSYGLKREVAFSHYPELESSLLYGGYPSEAMRNKFLMSKPCEMLDLQTNKIEIDYFEIKGHWLDMVAYKTKDNVYFIGDSLFPADIINKYHLFYIYSIKDYLQTLELLLKINEQDDVIFVPSHGVLSKDISEVVELNKRKIMEVIALIKQMCGVKITFDDLFKQIFDYYQLTLDLNQYLLIGSTIRNYLTYLLDKNEIAFIFEDNKLYYLTKEQELLKE